MSLSCALCDSKELQNFFEDEDRGKSFFHCQDCDLIFKNPKIHLVTEEEKSRYLTHENNFANEGYRKFLNPVVQMVVSKIKKPAHGLDYGCGPGEKVLARMLTNLDYEMSVFDPFFADDTSVLTRSYDFITCTEVAEHFYKPKTEFNKLNSLLKDQGYLFVMTNQHEGPKKFKEWYYHKDPTHVSFYSRKTFEFIARRQNWRVEFPQAHSSLAAFKKI